MDKKHLSDGHRPTIGDPHKIGNTTGTTQKDPAPKRILLNDPPRRFPGLQTKGILAIHGFARPHTIAIGGWVINIGRHLAMRECDWSGKGGTPREHVNSALAPDIPVKFQTLPCRLVGPREYYLRRNIHVREPCLRKLLPRPLIHLLGYCALDSSHVSAAKGAKLYIRTQMYTCTRRVH